MWNKYNLEIKATRIHALKKFRNLKYTFKKNIKEHEKESNISKKILFLIYILLNKWLIFYL